MPAWLRRLWMFFQRRRWEADLAAEMELHRELRAAELGAAGARRRFGNELLLRERARDAWGWIWLDDLAQDLRLAARGLVRSRGLALAAIVTLALGIGVNVAVFAAVQAVLLRPLPYPLPARLVALHATVQGEPVQDLSYPDLIDFTHGGPFATLAMLQWDQPVWTGRGPARAMLAARITPAWFRLLGMQPALGRAFDEQDRAPGRGRVAILSDGLWRAAFGGRRDVLGRTVTLDGARYTIVGVAPPGFGAIEGSAPNRPRLWLPLSEPAASPWMLQRGARMFLAFARLRPGVSLAAAQAAVDRQAAVLARAYPKSNAGWGASLVPVREELTGSARPILLLLWGAAGLILLLACANVGHLLLARSVGRRHEFAIRRAIGAGRRRLARQLLAEGLLLALLGGAAGVLVAIWALRLLPLLAPPAWPNLPGLRLAAPALFYALGAIFFATLLVSLLPALRAGRADPVRDLHRTESAGAPNRPWRGALVASEVALALVLAIGAGLLLRALANLWAAPLGFDPSGLITAEVSLPQERFARPEAQRRFFATLAAQVAALPGARDVALSSATPFLGSRGAPFQILGRPPEPDLDTVYFTAVSAGYFRALGIRVLRGRGLASADGPGAPPVAVINEAMARRYWPGRSPLGQQLKFGVHGMAGPWLIVGVAASTRQGGFATPPAPEVFLACAQVPLPDMTLFVRAGQRAPALEKAITARLAARVPDLPAPAFESMHDVMADTMGRRHIVAWLLGIFAVLALALAAVGVHGVLAYLARERAHEFGVRLALGARPPQLLASCLREAALWLALGLAAGTAVALWATRTVTSLLYGIRATDAATFATAAALLAAAELLAAWLPARRASRLDPARALRHE